MQKTITEYLAQFRQNRKKHKKYTTLLVALSILVAAGVTWQMQLTGISMTGDLICAQEEHSHTEACFEKTLICAEEEIPGHFHSMDCYEPLPDPEPVLVCGQEEQEAHTHGDGCYEMQQTLICAQTEHSHSDACDEEVRELVGGRGEHTHDGNCMEEVRELICAAGEHTHGDDCYDENGDLICGQEEHSHSDECYSISTRQSCGLEEHVHDDSCYTVSTQRTCGLDEHPHSTECYTEKNVLVCTKPEGEGHAHSKGCYALPEEGPYTCPIPEHIHGEDCYDVEGNLICPCMEHAHSDSCPKVELVCGQEEREPGHVHTDACYEHKLACQVEEHTHTDECYEDVEMPTESPEDWEADLPGLIGIWADDLVRVAKSQLGYTESEENYIEDENGEIHRYTRYGHWYGDPYMDWNAAFASFCLRYAGLEQSMVPYGSGAWAWSVALQKKELYLTGGTPEVGDLVFFDTEDDDEEDNQSKVDRVGIVSRLTEETLYTIEGDAEGTVAEVEYVYPDIMGYVPVSRLDEAGKLPTEESTVSTDPTETTGETIPLEPLMPMALPIEGELVDGGSVTDTVYWKLTKNALGEHTLTIYGSGPMQDYPYNSSQPWRDYYDLEKRVVIEAGVTSIGQRAFVDQTISTLSIGNDVSAIGAYAFAYENTNRRDGLKEVTIPGNVKAIGISAFYGLYNLTSVTLEDGIETIGKEAFGNIELGEVVLPATLKAIEGDSFNNARSFKIDNTNPYFTTMDGVLYNKDTTKLVKYPHYAVSDVYEIPSTVTEIGENALYNAGINGKLIVPNTVTSMEYGLGRSDFRGIYIEDGTILTGGSIFHNSTELATLRLPENTPLEMGEGFFGYIGFSPLSTLRIPNGTTRIDGFDKSSGVTNLINLIYDAESAEISDYIPSSPISENLIIGKNVDSIPLNFKNFLMYARKIQFEPRNAFNVTEGAFAGAPAPLDTLSGDVYVDNQGLVYSYDKGTSTAKLVYCPAGVTTANVPGTIRPEDGLICTVTAVGSGSLIAAEDLTALMFEAPNAITDLEDYALANCPTLTSVNNVTTVEEAEALFSTAQKGSYIFFNTGLTGSIGNDAEFVANMNGYKTVTVAKTLNGDAVDKVDITIVAGGETSCKPQWKPNGTDEAGVEVGGYTVHTGDPLIVKASINNTKTTQNYFRLYLKKTSSDAEIDWEPGETTSINGREIRCYGTSDSNVIYLECQQIVGDTLAIPIVVNYPSPQSSGGGITAWGVILTEEERNALGSAIPESQYGTIQAVWTTEPARFKLQKDNINNDKQVPVLAEQGIVRPSENLNWKISMTRQNKVMNCGKDYVKSVDFTDTLILPAGIGWDDDVLAAIQAGNVSSKLGAYQPAYYEYFIFADGKEVMRLLVPIQTKFQWGGLSLDDAGNAVLSWRVYNNTENELSISPMYVYVRKNALTVMVNSESPKDGFQIGGDNMVKNQIQADFHYNYSRDWTSPIDDATVNIIGGQGKLELTKAVDKEGTYFGEDIDYTVTLTSRGAVPYMVTEPDGVEVYDNLPSDQYISPENMERMFAAVEGQNARLYFRIQPSWVDRAPATDAYSGGKTAYRNPANSDMGTSTGEQGLLIEKTAGEYTVSAESLGKTVTNAVLKDALDEIGYVVTVDAKYDVYWVLKEENAEVPFVMKPGESKTFPVYATAKDTFQLLYLDLPNSYFHGSNQEVEDFQKNEVSFGTRSNNETDYTITAYPAKETELKPEAYLSQTVSKSIGEISNGDILEYTVKFTHYGQSEYDNLPMVDDLYGDQYLLVPQAENKGLDKKYKGQVEKIGRNYFILKNGTFSNVTVGTDEQGKTLIADTITVTKYDDETVTFPGETTPLQYSGIHTEIKWYFPHFDGGDWYTEVKFNTLVDFADKAVVSLGNIPWMNDRTNDRLYDKLWGDGVMLDFDKKLITSRDPEVVDEDDYSTIDEGDKVTYRLTLENPFETPFVINNQGSDTDDIGQLLVDVLPDNGGAFQWIKNENVQIEFVPVAGAINWPRQDEWTLGTFRNETDQAIGWPKNTVITFPGYSKIYLYVTLTFPTGAHWEDYTKAIGTSMLENTFWVYNFSREVNHELKLPGRVVLQKGVDAVLTNASLSYFSANIGSHSRQYYQNDNVGYVPNYVQYYVTIYNDSPKRLYLTSLYDQVPPGFVYSESDIYSFNKSSKTVRRLTWDNPENIRDTGTATAWNGDWLAPAQISGTKDGVKYISVKVSKGGDSGGQFYFYFQKSPTTPEENYDEDRGLCYLNEGEAITFTYLCSIGKYNETDPTATNTIAMPYLDYLDSGVSQLEKTEVVVAAPNFVDAATQKDYFADQNDGNRQVLTAAEANAKGFTDSLQTEQWLVSEVIVERGTIVPGISKRIKSYSYTSEGEMKEETYVNHAPANAILNWEVTLRNTGYGSMVGYTVTDTMPYPYVFEGAVGLNVADCNGKLYYDFSHRHPTLFTLPQRTGNETELTATGCEGTAFTVPLNGTRVNVPGSGVWLSIQKAENQRDEVMTIYFPADRESNEEYINHGVIPAGGKGVLTFSSRAPSQELTNHIYTNQVKLTPEQNFDAVSDGSLVEEGKSITASASVTISGGDATSSVQKITEISNPDNIGWSDQRDGVPNAIVLENKESLFSYELTVSNDASVAMDKLVLINNLPEREDTSAFDPDVPRNSTFKVSLTGTPELIVKGKDGTEIVLTEGVDYTIDYSTGTGFDVPTDDDWNGEPDNTKWSGNSDGARWIRLVINDEAKSLLPPGAQITMTYNAKVDGEAKPGTTAWNSFGYRYQISPDGSPTIMEAMPDPVGVKIPSEPMIQKLLVDKAGNPAPTPTDTPQTFSFVIYEGEALEQPFNNLKELRDALNGAVPERQCAEFDLTVPAKASESPWKSLNRPGIPWGWTEGARYTIAELPCGENYDFLNFGGTDQNGTFTYESGKTISITATNQLKLWDLELTKVDSTKDTTDETRFLPGAVFGLYSPEQTDAMTDEVYNGLEFTPERIITDEENKTWHLYSVETTREGTAENLELAGTILWEGLNRDEYLLVELKAPDAYYLNPKPIQVFRPDSEATVELTVKNTPSFQLPQTGGAGTTPYFISGLLLMTAALMIECRRRRRERGSVH